MNRLLKILKSKAFCTIIALVFGFLAASLILLFSGYNPLTSFAVMFNSIFSQPKFIINVILKSTPIILTGISVAFAFKTGLFNIGAEGQYIVGMVASTVVGIVFNFHPAIQIPLVILAGMFAGMIWGGIIGFLKAKFGINEVLTGIMMNWITFYFSNYVIRLKYFFQIKTNSTLPINSNGVNMFLNEWKYSEEGLKYFRENPLLGEIILKTDFNFNFLIAILISVLVWVLVYKTRRGYEFRAVGYNSDASQNAGINVKRTTFRSMLIAGAISGLAGALALSGSAIHDLKILSMFENNGFNGLAVALISGASPIGCIFSGLLFSGLLYAGQTLQFKTGAPLEIINITIGTIVFFAALVKIIPFLVNKFKIKTEEKENKSLSK